MPLFAGTVVIIGILVVVPGPHEVVHAENALQVNTQSTGVETHAWVLQVSVSKGGGQGVPFPTGAAEIVRPRALVPPPQVTLHAVQGFQV